MLPGCLPGEKPTEPPLCGDYRVVVKTVGQQVRYDTIYHVLPEFALTNQAGQVVTAASTRGTVRIVHFFSTLGSPEGHLAQMQLLRYYQQWPRGLVVRFLSFALKPEYDTVEKLAAFAKESGINADRWQLLTGERTAVYAVGRDLFMRKDESPVSASELSESELILIDQQGRVRGFYQANSPATLGQLTAHAKRLLAQQ